MKRIPFLPLQLLAVVIISIGSTIRVVHSFTTTPLPIRSRINHMPSLFMFSPRSNQDNNNDNNKDSNDKKDNEYTIQTWNPFRWLVLRLGFTEPAMTSPLNYGTYAPDDTFVCAYCGTTLFRGNAKYDSGSGWPSFWRSANENSIMYQREWDNRLECRCHCCSSHLGHVFLDGPRPESVPTDLLQSSPSSDPRSSIGTYLPRFCINGAALLHRPSKREDEE